MRVRLCSITVFALVTAASPASARDAVAEAAPEFSDGPVYLAPVDVTPPRAAVTGNPQIDYPGFADLVGEVASIRRERRIDWMMFRHAARTTGSILLDTRSAADFARGHIRGAVNLPFSEFTDEKLREVLGKDTARPVYIYCNNNFSDNRAPVMAKRAPLALNIPTFINLYGYGYRNVWELGDVVAIGDLGREWVVPAITAAD